jgi:uncharacterized protein YqhQ
VTVLEYELIRFAGRNQQNRVVTTVPAPGPWLPRLTTRETAPVGVRVVTGCTRVEVMA